MTARPPPLNCSDAVPASELVDDFATSRGFNRAMVTRAESRGVVGFSVEFVGVYWPPLIAATRALSLSGKSSAIDVSER